MCLLDSYVGLLRMLLFLYTNTLPEGSDGLLLQDLLTADRYGLEDMKLAALQMLTPSLTNWVDLLRVSELLSLPALRHTVLCFLRNNFQALRLDALYQQYVLSLPPQPVVKREKVNGNDDEEVFYDVLEEDNDANKPQPAVATAVSHKQQQVLHNEISDQIMIELKSEFPTLFEEVFLSRLEYFPSPPNTLLITQTKKSKEHEVLSKKPIFPLWTLVLTAIGLLVYTQLTQVVSMGMWVPIMNIGGSLVLFVMLYHVVFNG